MNAKDIVSDKVLNKALKRIDKIMACNHKFGTEYKIAHHGGKNSMRKECSKCGLYRERSI